jgi:hypothetical protein
MVLSIINKNEEINKKKNYNFFYKFTNLIN